jgi:hypothetical protein
MALFQDAVGNRQTDVYHTKNQVKYSTSAPGIPQNDRLT